MLSAEPKVEVDNAYMYRDYSEVEGNKRTVMMLLLVFSCIEDATYRLVKKSFIKRLIQSNTNFNHVCHRSSDTYQL